MDRTAELERVLIEAMVRLHGHVVHCGTRLEDEALRLLGAEPPPFADGYRAAWERVAEARALRAEEEA